MPSSMRQLTQKGRLMACWVFYKSPVGQAMVDKSPTLMKQSSEIVQERKKAATPELQKLMKD